MTDEIAQLEEQITKLQQKLHEARRRASEEPVADYEFRQPDGSVITLSQLFDGQSDLLAVHNMGKSCSYCTLWADGFQGLLPHLTDRAAFVVISPDSPEVQREFAAGRGWTFRMASCAGNSFAADMGFEPEAGTYWPGISGFRKYDDGTIVRTGRAEFGPGDVYCPVWHMFDLLAGGAGDWQPQYRYGETVSPKECCH